MRKISTVLILFAFALIINSCGKKTEDKGVTGKVIQFVGKATINGQKIDLNKPVKYGDVIETGDDGTCHIQVGEKSLFMLNKNTKLVFNISKDRNELTLEKGWFAGITRKVFSAKGKYILKTPTVIAAIRGTSYCVKVENPKSTYFCVCNGTIGLEGSGEEKSTDVSAAHHSAKRFEMNEKGKLVIDKTVGMLYHTDENLEKLASIISEKIDWKKAF